MTTPQKQKGRSAANASTSTATTPGSKSTDNSAGAQRRRVLEYLLAGPQTTYSLRSRGISHPAQRIVELIKSGYTIESSRVSAVDSDGFQHSGVAMYSFADPQPQKRLFESDHQHH
jgi:hypothetical protein